MPFKIEDFKDDTDFQAFLKTSIDTAVTTSVAGLTAKNEEMAKSIKEYKEKHNLTDEEFKILEAQAAKAKELEEKARKGESEYEKILRVSQEQHTKELDEIKGKFAKQDKVAKKNLIVGELSTALAAVNCNPALIEAAIKLVQDDVAVIEEDGSLVAKVGDKSVREFITSWAKDEVGKNFILAKHSTGGGGKKHGDGFTEDEAAIFFDPESTEFNQTRQFEILESDPDLHKRLVAKYAGKPIPIRQASSTPGAPRPSYLDIPGVK